MSDNCRVSEALYVGLCRHIGTPTEVTVRREVMDIEEVLHKPVLLKSDIRMMVSGSYREGFRLKSSDRDFMYWMINLKVITDVSQSKIYDPSKHFIFLMEDSDTPPGFVRLKLLTSPPGKSINAAVPFNGGMYISNLKVRQIMLTSISLNKSHSKLKMHGPCANGIIEFEETDHALCFHCSQWSQLTYEWKERCDLRKWPPTHVFEDIIKHGFHFVPISSKNLDNENELEWRISFSQAEQKLVYCMSHSQFLCYGLLKIFLKEVVNSDTEESILCSYFLKTTLFWIIQMEHITWYPNDLLHCFWTCIKYLLGCIYLGMLPNFFIPYNNMFASKLATADGVRKLMHLSEQLNGYTKTGVSCLLQSPTLRSIIEPVICNRYLRIEPVVGHATILADLDKSINMELQRVGFSTELIRNCYIYLNSVFRLSQLSLTEYQTLTLRKCFVEVLIEIASQSVNSLSGCNRKVYRQGRFGGILLKLAGKLGDVSHLLYLAMYNYRKCRIREALNVTFLVKSRLYQPYLMYYDRVDTEKYNESVSGWSLPRRMNRACAKNVFLRASVYYIHELQLEQKVREENGQEFLKLSAFVLANMLNVLCNYRLGNRSQYEQSLTDLHKLLLCEEGTRVSLLNRDLSWQVLGICQHVVGDLQGAIQSYQVSLRQRPYQRIQKATMYRTALVLFQLYKGTGSVTDMNLK